MFGNGHFTCLCFLIEFVSRRMKFGWCISHTVCFRDATMFFSLDTQYELSSVGQTCMDIDETHHHQSFQSPKSKYNCINWYIFHTKWTTIAFYLCFRCSRIKSARWVSSIQSDSVPHKKYIFENPIFIEKMQ